jgi:leucyl/phenylalanyl-tRNA---protein transferase
MPIYALDDRIIFPDPNLADESGLLAVGGDLSPERLLLAYSSGIFPWYSENDPIMWWSPDPRMILIPERMKVSKSIKQSLNKKTLEIRFDTRFESVIASCSKAPGRDQDGTWITDEMKQAYLALHNLGYAHSVETYDGNELVGGLYGISLGKAFFGESMFFKKRDASKIALYFLVQKLMEWDFHFIDAQVETDHLKSMGANLVPRKEFLNSLNLALKYPTIQGKW